MSANNMKIFNSKKSLVPMSNIFFMMLFVGVLGGMGVMLVKIGNVQVAEASRIPEDVEDEFALMSRFFNSGDCFSYKDNVGRVHTGVIDYNEFTQTTLDTTCFPEGSPPSRVSYAFKLSLEPPPVPVGPVIFPVVEIETFNWDLSRYVRKEIVKDVTIRFNNNLYNGKLRIEIKNV